MNILGGLINNGSALLALALAYSLLIDHLPRERLSTRLLGGTLFGLVALVGMSYPVTLEPGLIFDARTVIVAMAGLFGGWPAAAVSALIVGGFRAWLGGVGVWMGLGVIATAAVFGLGLRALHRAGRMPIDAGSLALFGLLMHLLALSWSLLLPAQLRETVISTVAVPYLLVMPALTVLLGLLLRSREQHVDDERALRESRERLEKIAAHIPGAIYQYQQWPDGLAKFPYASPAMKDVYGIEPAAIARDATPMFAVIHPDDLGHVQRSIAHSMETLTVWHDICRIRHPAGHTLWLEGESSPEPQPDGSVLWSGYLRDISDRVQMEAAVDATRATLEAALASMRDAVFISDADGNLLHINQAFATFHRFAGVDECCTRLGTYHDVLEVQLPDGTPVAHDQWAIPRALRGETAVDQEYRLRRKDTAETWIGSYDLAPIRARDGRIVGSVVTARDITETRAHEAELAHIANHDQLTGLPNRRLLTDRLTQAIAHSRRSALALAVCYLDLDGFKPINDRYGHEVGDQLLIKVAESLRRILRGHDTVARLGGDEFVLLLTRLGAPEDCAQLLDRVLATIRRPIVLAGASHQVSASIGVSLQPPDSADPDTLLRHADQAMYRAKELGKNTFHIYDPSQDRALHARRLRRGQLGEALERDELVLYFQPQVHLISREVIGAEALIRWQHPEQGLLPPGAFLPEIEGSVLEIAVGEWVIDHALAQIERWSDAGLHLPISVNIAAGHLMQPAFAKRLAALLQAHGGVAPGDLELEILESAAFSDFEQARAVLVECRELGVRFALDDFGTGYSSLAYFRALPIDLLKIDQCFVRDMLDDPGDMEIVESVVRLSQAFNRSVIAEGVETLEHAALLTWLGCRRGQGYGIARPMPAADLPGWISGWSAQTGWLAGDETRGRDDIPLIVAAQNHLHWIDRVARAVDGEDGLGDIDMTTETCPFGRWYLGHGSKRCGNLAAYRDLGPLHQRVHAVAAGLLAKARAGETAAAQDGMQELFAARDAMFAAMARLVRQVRPGSKPAADAPR